MPLSIKSLSENQLINDVMDSSTAGVYCLLATSDSKHGKTFVHYSKDIHKLAKLAKSKPFQHRNCYLSFNTFASWHRLENNVLGLNGLFIDIDCVKNGVDKGELLYYLPYILKEAGLPKPNVKIDSGHGMYVKWYFKQQVIVHNQCINRLWNKLERTIVNRFNHACRDVFGVELGDSKATDSSRVLRIPDTWNVKATPIQCKLIDYRRNARFDMFTDWVKDYLPVIHYQRRKQQRHKFRPKINVKIVKNGYTLNGYRLIDLLTWLKLHRFNITGKREEFLFIYACNALNCEAVTTVIRDINRLNDELVTSLPDSEIKNLVIELTHINLRKYKFKNQTIIDKLGITVSDQTHMKTLLGSEVNHHRYQKRLLRRKNQRRVSRLKRNHKKAVRDDKIMELHNRGLSLRKIAKRLKIGKNTVSRVIKRCPKTRSLYSVLESRKCQKSISDIHIIYINKVLLHDISNLVDINKNYVLNNVHISRIRDD